MFNLEHIFWQVTIQEKQLLLNFRATIVVGHDFILVQVSGAWQYGTKIVYGESVFFYLLRRQDEELIVAGCQASFDIKEVAKSCTDPFFSFSSHWETRRKDRCI